MCMITARYPSSTHQSDALYFNQEYVHIAQLSGHAASFNNDQSWCEVGDSDHHVNSLSIYTLRIVDLSSSAIDASTKSKCVHQDAT